MPIVLVGNKIDLEGERQVSHNDAVALAQTYANRLMHTCRPTHFVIVHQQYEWLPVRAQ